MKYISLSSYHNSEFLIFRNLCIQYAKRYVFIYPKNCDNSIRGSLDVFAEFSDDIADLILKKFKTATAIEKCYQYIYYKYQEISAKEEMDRYEEGETFTGWIYNFYKN